MQDVQNIPNPDVNTNITEDDFGSHSEQNQDVERPEEDIPVPPDRQGNAPIEEPPDAGENKPPIDEPNTEPKRIA